MRVSERSAATHPEELRELRGLTLKRPWSYAVSHLGKTVENRTWEPDHQRLPLAIMVHAGLAWDGYGAEFLTRAGLSFPTSRSCPSGAVVALALVYDVVGPDALLGTMVVEDQPWKMDGQYGWLLCDLQVLEKPVPCRGGLGLWRPTAEVRDQVAREPLCRAWMVDHDVPVVGRVA